MAYQQKSSRTLEVALWLAQVLLAVSLLWAGVIKLFQPVRTLASMWPWAGDVNVALLKVTGILDLAAGLGLILPWLLRIRPKLTPIAALGVSILMICAIVFHLARGEGRLIGVNIFFMITAGFVAWGRFDHAPVSKGF